MVEISQDAFEIELRFLGVGEAQGLLKRHLAPLTVGRIYRSLKQAPITGPIMRYGTGQFCLQTSVVAGTEKEVREVAVGELAYSPQMSTICMFSETQAPYSPVNRIGVITEGLELFEKLRTGLSLVIQLKDEG